MENEAGTGSGYLKMAWELIGWDGHAFKTAFKATSSCTVESYLSLRLKGRLTLTSPGQTFLTLAYDFTARLVEGAEERKDTISGHWDEEFHFDIDAFRFEPMRPPVKLIRDFAMGLCDANG